MKHRLALRLLAALVTLAAAPLAAPLQEPVVEYRVDLRQPQTQTLEVTVTVPTTGVTEEFFSLPVWRPGRYTVLNPAGTVRGVHALSETGESLPIRKSGTSTWRVETRGAESVSVSYTVYANSLGDRTRHVDPTHAFLSGSSVFFYSPRLRGAPLTVELDLPAGWGVAGGLELAPGRDDVLVAPDYDVLVDSPLELGEHERIEFTVGGKPHEIVIWPTGLDYDADTMVEDFTTIIEEQNRVFEELPYERYVFLIHAGKGVGGGTEHLNSTIMQTSEAALEGSRDGGGSYDRFLGLVAHEFFHTWNVKQFRPDGIHPYDYQDENCTDLLWVCEGSTSYYTTLSLVRSELREVDATLRSIERSADRLRKNPAARVQSVAEASWDSWVSSSDPDSRNRTVDFYGKGSQVSMCLDLELRRRTENRVDYDDVMRALYERYPLDGSGYTSDDLLALVDELSGSSFAEFFEAYVFGTEELPFESALETAGLEFAFEPRESVEGDDGDGDGDGGSDASAEDEVEPVEMEAADEPVAEPEPVARPELPLKAHLGLRLSGGGSGSTVSGFTPDGPAWRSGLMLGDEILTLDERRLRSGDLESRLRDFEPGEVVRLHYLRDDLLRTIEIELGGVPDGRWTLERVDEPTELQKAVYADWLGQAWPEDESEGEDVAPEGAVGPEAAPAPQALPEAEPEAAPPATGSAREA